MQNVNETKSKKGTFTDVSNHFKRPGHPAFTTLDARNRNPLTYFGSGKKLKGMFINIT